MKKLITAILILAFLLSLSGCSSREPAEEATPEPELHLSATESASEPELHMTETEPASEPETHLSETEPAPEKPTEERETGSVSETEKTETVRETEAPAETKPDHICSYEAKVIPATCTEQGYTLYTCTVCGKSYQGNWTAALGHAYVDTVVPATTEAGGYTEHVCSRCGYTYRDNETPKLEPRWDTEETVSAICAEMNAYIRSLGFDNNERYCGCWAGQSSTAAPGTSPEWLRKQLKEGIDSFAKRYSDLYVVYIASDSEYGGFCIRLQYEL